MNECYKIWWREWVGRNENYYNLILNFCIKIFELSAYCLLLFFSEVGTFDDLLVECAEFYFVLILFINVAATVAVLTSGLRRFSFFIIKPVLWVLFTISGHYLHMFAVGFLLSRRYVHVLIQRLSLCVIGASMLSPQLWIQNCTSRLVFNQN